MTLAPDDPVLFQFFNEIGIIEQLARNRFESVMPAGLTSSQFTVLNHFVRLGDGKTPADLARAFQVTKGAITNTLGKLESKGLVAVEPDASDGRSKRVYLTEAGRAMRFEAIARLAPEFEKILGTMPADEFRAALPFLRAVRTYLDTARDRK